MLFVNLVVNRRPAAGPSVRPFENETVIRWSVVLVAILVHLCLLRLGSAVLVMVKDTNALVFRSRPNGAKEVEE